ncbi:MAG: AMP-binding protein [Acidimicrobiia bacterium]|nr:AMP-binding protein [Acidimicrobiia bacterium]
MFLPTVGDVLSTHARVRPNDLGARDLDRSLTYSGWNERACRLANALVGLGLSHGQRVAVLAYNRLEWAEIYAAVAKSGLVAVPINFRLTGPEVAYIINDSGAEAVIVEHALIDVIESVRTDLVVPAERFILVDGAAGPTHAGEYRSYEKLLAGGAPTEPSVIVGPDDTACLMYTSGTTGNPKGAVRSHRGLTMLALCTGLEFRLRPGDTALLVMPMCHANSLYFFVSFLHRGAPITVFSRSSFDPELCLAQLGRATFSSLVPTHYSLMLEVPEARRPDTTSVEKLLVSSATAFVETKRRIMDMFPNSGLYELYGSTEAGWVTMLHPDEQFDHLGSVGREVVGSAPIRMLDDDGVEVPDGEPGELFSSSPYQFDGYWNLPDRTAEAMRGDYLSVGDIALRDEQGYIQLIDRKKNMIVTGGENVYPSEVENVLAEHPDVADVAVVGVPDPRWSEQVVAAVVARSGTSPSAEDLTRWTAERLAGYKRPRRIEFLEPEQMPRNATGKILHRTLREMFTEKESP